MSEEESSNEDIDKTDSIQTDVSGRDKLARNNALQITKNWTPIQWETIGSLFNFSHSIYHGLKQPPDPTTLPVDDLSADRYCHGDDILLIKIEEIDNDIDEICIDPFIRVHPCCATSGKYLPNLMTRRSRNIRSNKNEQFVESLPASQSQHRLRGRQSNKRKDGTAFQWIEENLIIHYEYGKILHPDTILLFEVLDRGCVNHSPASDGMKEKEATSLMWGFLKPIGRNNHVHIGTRAQPSSTSPPQGESKVENFSPISSIRNSDNELEIKSSSRCQLQLFKWQRDSWFVRRQAKRWGFSSSLIPAVYLQYLRKHYHVHHHSSLIVNIGPISRPPSPTTGKVVKEGSEEQKMNHQDEEDVENGKDAVDDKPLHNRICQYARQPEEKCLIPDIIHSRFNHNGAFQTSFSNSGDHLAIASKSCQVYVHNLKTGETEYESSHHHHGDIVGIAWSMDDSMVSCASLDGTISIHKLEDQFDHRYMYIKESPQQRCFKVFFVGALLTPTSFLFYPTLEQIPLIIAGLNDGSVSLWNVTRESSQQSDLLSGIRCHSTAVQAVEVDSSNGRMYTGDEKGKIVIWKPKSKHVINGKDFEVLLQIDSQREIFGKAIINLSLNPANERSKQLLITTRAEENCLFVYDLVSHDLAPFGIHTETKYSAFTVAKYSPDGRFVLGGTKDGRIALLQSFGGTPQKVRRN
jgi:WD40 repeat protein